MAVDGNWTDPREDAAQIAWVCEGVGAPAEFGTGSAYLNFSGRAGDCADAGVDDALAEPAAPGGVKTAYDPENLFRRNHNIVPAF